MHRAGGAGPSSPAFQGRHSHWRPTCCCSPPVFDPPTPWPGNPGWRSGSAAASASTTAATVRIRHPRHRRVRALAGAHLRPGGPGYQMARPQWPVCAAARPLYRGRHVHQAQADGVDVGSIGDAHASTAGAQELLLLDRVNGIYKKLVTDGEGNRLLGAILVGTGPITSGCCSTTRTGWRCPSRRSPCWWGGQGPPRAPWCCRTAPSSAPCHNVSKGTWWPPFGRAITSCRR